MERAYTVKAIALIFQDEWFSMEGKSPASLTMEADYYSLKGNLPIHLFTLQTHLLLCSESCSCAPCVAYILIFLPISNIFVCREDQCHLCGFSRGRCLAQLSTKTGNREKMLAQLNHKRETQILTIQLSSVHDSQLAGQSTGSQETLLLVIAGFTFLYYCKLNIFEFWTVFGQNKTCEDIISLENFLNYFLAFDRPTYYSRKYRAD